MITACIKTLIFQIMIPIKFKKNQYTLKVFFFSFNNVFPCLHANHYIYFCIHINNCKKIKWNYLYKINLGFKDLSYVNEII